MLGGLALGLGRRLPNALACEGVVQNRQLFRWHSQLDASRLARRACDKPASFQSQDHQMRARRCHLEEMCYLRFSRRASVQGGVMVNKSEYLALSGCVVGFHSHPFSHASVVTINRDTQIRSLAKVAIDLIPSLSSRIDYAKITRAAEGSPSFTNDGAPRPLL